MFATASINFRMRSLTSLAYTAVDKTGMMTSV